MNQKGCVERFVFTKYGIFRRKGKIVKRHTRGGELKEFFRTVPIGEEYPLSRTAEKLTSKQQIQFNLAEMELQLEQLHFEKAKYPEDAERIENRIKEVKSKIAKLKSEEELSL